MAVQRTVSGQGAENNVYTVLSIVATLFVLIATIILAVQFNNFYGLENIMAGPPVVGG